MAAALGDGHKLARVALPVPEALAAVAMLLQGCQVWPWKHDTAHTLAIAAAERVANELAGDYPDLARSLQIAFAEAGHVWEPEP